MEASARHSAKVQLHLDMSALVQTEERRRAVKAALDDAKATARRASAQIAALQPELDTLLKKSARLERNVRDQRGIVVRCILATFPLELLRAIILELIYESDESDTPWPCGSYNRSRALVPFALSAVCRRWRTLALDTAEVWTYLGVPAIDESVRLAKSSYRYVVDVLQRSRSSPLDIMLDWCASPSSHWQSSQFYQQILDLLATQTTRWKRVQVQLPRGVTKRHLGAFRLPTPILEELYVLCVGDDNPRWTSRPPTYLPFCPRLRRLTAHKIFVVAREPMLALTFLSINAVSVGIDAVEGLLRMTPALETLRIWFPTDENLDLQIVAPAPIALPELTSLRMEGDLSFFPTWATGLQMPKLRLLKIDTLEISSLSQYFQSVDLRLETLHLVCHFDDCRLSTTAATHLRQLSHLQRLVLQDCEHIHAAFFSSLAPPSLPHLNELQLQRVTLKDDIAESLVQFVRARKQPVADEPSANARAPLKVELVDADVPPWLAPQLSTVAVECAVLGDDASDSSSSDGSSGSEHSSLDDDDDSDSSSD